MFDPSTTWDVVNGSYNVNAQFPLFSDVHFLLDVQDYALEDQLITNEFHFVQKPHALVFMLTDSEYWDFNRS